MHTLNDQQLVQLMQAGSRPAFQEMIKRYQKMAHHLALRYVKSAEKADDVTQEAFLKVFQKIDLFRGDSSFKSWLYRIIVNTAKNLLRAQNLRDCQDISTVPMAAQAEDEDNVEKEQTVQALKCQVMKLAPKQRQAVVLRIYEDLSFKEIAEIMNCPFDTAKANFRHGLLKMRKALQVQHPEIIPQDVLSFRRRDKNSSGRELAFDFADAA